MFAGVVFQNYGKMMLAEAFEPAGFKLALGLKDVDLSRAAAADLKVPMRFGAVLHDQFSEAVQNGMADKDWSALADLIGKQARLLVFKKLVDRVALRPNGLAARP